MTKIKTMEQKSRRKDEVRIVDAQMMPSSVWCPNTLKRCSRGCHGPANCVLFKQKVV